MGRSFHLLLDDVLVREKRNRGIVLLFVVVSVTTSLMFLYVLSRFYPRWCAYVAIPLVPATLYWVARSGVRSSKVSRLEAAALIDSTLDTRDRGTTLVELEQSPAPNNKAHIDLLSRQLSTIIPFTTSSKTVNPYTLGQAERRAIIISAIASILCVVLVAFRPLSTRDLLAREIESALADLPQPQHQIQEMAQRVIDTMRNPNSSSSEIQSAIKDAKLALKNAASITPQESRTSVVITPSSKNNTTEPKPAVTPGTAQPNAQLPQQDASKQPQPTQPQEPRRAPQDSKNQQQQQQQSTSADEKSKEAGAGQQRSGDGNQGDSPSDSSQSENQNNSSEKNQSSSESSQQSKSNDSSNQESDQNNEQQSGGSQGSGSGKGSAGSDSTADSQQEGSSGGSGSGKSGKGGGEQNGEHEQRSSDDSSAGSEGEASSKKSGAQKLSKALDKAAQSLQGESNGNAGQPPSSQSDGESSQDQGSKSDAQSKKAEPDKARQSESKAKGSGSSDQKSPEEAGKERDKDSKNDDSSSRGASSEKRGDSREQSKASQAETKGEPSSPKDPKDSQRQGSPETSEQGDEAKDQKDQQPSNTHGNQDGTGEKSRIVEGKATPRHYEEGGPDGPPGAGLGGKEGFKDVQLGNTKESFDTRFTGQDSTEEEGKGPAQPKTTIEDLTLSKPKPSVDRGEQRIPLEYKDILR